MFGLKIYTLTELILIVSALNHVTTANDLTLFKEIWDQTFKGNPTIYEPAKTFEFLRSIYEIQSNRAGANSYITRMLEACIINQNKCNPEALKKLNRLYALSPITAPIIDPYVDHCVVGQFSVCKNKFRIELEDSVRKLNSTEIQDLTVLDDIYIKPLENKTVDKWEANVHFHHIGLRLSEFFDKQGPKELKMKRNFPEWEAEIMAREQLEAISKKCQIILEKTSQAASNYNIFLKRAKVVMLYDRLSSDWIPRINLCRTIVSYARERPGMVCRAVMVQYKESRKFINKFRLG